MKKWIAKPVILLLATMIATSFTSCEGLFPDKEEEEDTLYVKFMNESASQYTITTIQIRPRGPVMEEQTPTENWSSNLLTANQTIPPGGHVFFTLDIPSGHWSEYRLGVDDGEGNQIMLHEQTNYSGMDNLPITHWGGDTRTVSPTIVWSNDANMIVVTGWSDWTGIDD